MKTMRNSFGVLKVFALAALVGVGVPCVLAETDAGETPVMAEVTITRVQQRYPWNAKADIAYTLAHAQNIRRIDFKLTDSTTGETFVKRIDYAVAPDLFTDGAHVFTWNLKDLPHEIKVDDATVSMTIYAEN